MSETTIALCGMMGSGKSAIGRRLADMMGFSFTDSDALIAQRAGMPVARIFETQGEEAFRRMEREILAELLEKPGGVIGLGGGSLQHQELVERMKKTALLCFIDTPLDVISERVQRNTKRPLLLDADGRLKPESEIRALLESLYQKRLPLYARAHLRYVPKPANSVQTSARELHDLIQKA